MFQSQLVLMTVINNKLFYEYGLQWKRLRRAIESGGSVLKKQLLFVVGITSEK
jgi:hypothetical protein